MTERRPFWVLLAVGSLVFLAASAGCLTGPDGGDSSGTPTPDSSTVHEGYEETTVRAVDGETDEELGVVTAALADNSSLRYTGLSETDAMPSDRGMLFVFAEAQDLTFVMRNMSFGLDIVFVAGNGTITHIHHAPEPAAGEDGSNHRYPGHGRYVLEVNRNWTTDHGVAVGDRLEFELPA